MTVLMATGHRPQSLGNCFDWEHPIRVEIRRLVGGHLDTLQPTVAITGMALGFDQDFAMAALDRGIEVHAYIPSSPMMQYSRWPQASKDFYHKILDRCTHRVDVPGSYPHVLQLRNEAMVDASTHCLALWNGQERGGTWNCLRYLGEQWGIDPREPYGYGEHRLSIIDPTPLILAQLG